MSDKDTPPLTGKDLARKPRGFPDKRESLIHAQAGLVETIMARCQLCRNKDDGCASLLLFDPFGNIGEQDIDETVDEELDQE